MKLNKTILWCFGILTVIAALYRLIPDRPYGFAPQWAMAIFAGAVIKDKKYALLVPVLSMFIADLFFHVLFLNGLSDMQGFYEGQWQNYLLFGLLTFIGFAIKKLDLRSIFVASLASPTLYFILSNFVTWAGWAGTRGLGRPRTFNGLMMAYTDGLPFYRSSLMATLVFSAVLFGGYILLIRNQPGKAAMAA